jgi:hypothetical protein
MLVPPHQSSIEHSTTKKSMTSVQSCARVHASSAFLFFVLLVVANILVATAATNLAPRFHQNVKSNTKSDDSSALLDNSHMPVSVAQPPQLKRRKKQFNLNHIYKSEVNGLFKGKQQSILCKMRKYIGAGSELTDVDASSGRTKMKSSVPRRIKMLRKRFRDKTQYSKSVYELVSPLNETSESACHSSVRDINVSAPPDEGKVEEKKLPLNLEKVRLDVLVRLEDEQQQLSQQQQPLHGSANRSHSIPLIHRSTTETLSSGVNYASAALGAKIVSSNTEGKHANALLSAEEERYWMSPCSANRSVVIELAESVLVKSITLMHNEYYSSISRAVLLQGAQILPTDR